MVSTATLLQPSFRAKVQKLLKVLVYTMSNPIKALLAIDHERESSQKAQLNSRWFDQEYILKNIFGATRELYDANRDIVELEHQIGRFLNMEAVCRQITAERQEGDVLEFGTWQGLGLILLSHCFSDDSTTRKLIGIDSFEGLPTTSTVWSKGDFDNTSIELARRNIQRKMNPSANLSFDLIQGWFCDPRVAKDLWSICSEVVLVHFDADLGSSTSQALALVEPYLVNREKPIYFLFDDWGCHPDEVPDAFFSWLTTAESRFHLRAEKLSSTRYTRYYKITFVAG